jgi:MFS family permease
MRRLLACRNFRLYLGGQGLSMLGDSSLWLAMGIWVKVLTGSSSAAGLVFFAFVAGTLTAPLSGALVDRTRRRPLLIAVNLATGVMILGLLPAGGRHGIWVIYLVMFGYGVSNGLLAAGQSALLRDMVPAGLLADANGVLTTIREGLRVAAPLAGAGLFALTGPRVIVIVDAASFAAAAAALSLISVREPRRGGPPPTRAPGWAELSAGARHIIQTIPLRQAVLAAIVAVLGIGFFESLVFAVSAQGLHHAPTFTGVLMSVQGVGALAAGPTAAPVVRRIGEGWAVGAGLAVCAGSALLMIPSSLATVLAGCVLLGAALPWIVVGLTTLLQRLTPPGLQGRVAGTADLAISTPQAMSIALGAGLLAVTGYRVLLVCVSVACLLAAGYLLSRGEQRPRALAPGGWAAGRRSGGAPAGDGERHRHDGELRVHFGARRQDRGVGDPQTGRAAQPAVGVDGAALRVGAHPRAAGRVEGGQVQRGGGRSRDQGGKGGGIARGGLAGQAGEDLPGTRGEQHPPHGDDGRAKRGGVPLGQPVADDRPAPAVHGT